MDLNQAFGGILKEKRRRAKMSQEALAHECGVDRTYISQLERGLKNPSLKVLFALSGTLKIRPSKFIADLEKMILGS